MSHTRYKATKLYLLVLLLCMPYTFYARPRAKTGLRILFNEDKAHFTPDEKERITEFITASERKIRRLLPDLPEDITVSIELTDNDFKDNGGVIGRAERNRPAKVVIEVSSAYQGGVGQAIKTGLIPVIYHEFHHLARGWAIQDNKYDTDIHIAAVNEGLAVVFSEIYTGVVLPWNTYPNNVSLWVEEIIALPENSNYRSWMFQHPDGRIGIGYKAGNFIVREAMANSNKDILELSKLSHRKILKLAGYKR
ncbi:DUF2268 domain-containing putative Zn-dependent protease [Aestuariivivens sediminicola]|uniref:DUF2268 domain-containing putative Zn-dependent protease n=1 Tax=Aestuariivivens sediminicola TaxID=2913560 RepID=UPI001F5ADEA2|nr:DUF2268 domain-containing putative Zn-dependent protease [Aestuariivivens sediminicola]